MSVSRPELDSRDPAVASGPDPMADVFRAMLRARAVITGVSLGLFDALARRPRPSEALAADLHLDPLGVDLLVDALRALGYVTAGADGVLTAHPLAVSLLCSDSPRSMATFVGPLSDVHWSLLAGLDVRVTTGTGPNWYERPATDPTWRIYARALFELSSGEHDLNAALVPHPRPRSLLDIGGAHGAFAMAMCRRHPALRATVFDLPAAARAGREILAAEGFSERVTTVEGDALVDDLGEGHDVVSVFNVLQHLTPNAATALLRRAHAALARDGVVVVGETARRAPSREPAAQGAFTALLFYAMTGTQTYSVEELVTWMTDVGFDAAIYANPASPWRVVIVGSRKSDGAR